MNVVLAIPESAIVSDDERAELFEASRRRFYDSPNEDQLIWLRHGGIVAYRDADTMRRLSTPA